MSRLYWGLLDWGQCIPCHCIIAMFDVAHPFIMTMYPSLYRIVLVMLLQCTCQAFALLFVIIACSDL